MTDDLPWIDEIEIDPDEAARDARLGAALFADFYDWDQEWDKRHFPHDGLGRVDVSRGVPKGFVWIEGRAHVRCEKLKVPFARALKGYTKFDKHINADLFGVVVSEQDFVNNPSLALFPNSLDEGEVRSRKLQIKTLRKAEAHQREQDEFVAAIKLQFPGIPGEVAEDIGFYFCAPGTRRVGRNKSLPLHKRTVAAVGCFIRYRYTDFPELLKDNPREVAQATVRGQVSEKFKEWGLQ